MTLSTAFEVYASLQSTYVSKKTISSVYVPTRNSLLKFLGDRPIDEITSSDLIQWVAHELREKKREAGGLNIAIRTARSFGAFMAKQRILPRENPFVELLTLPVEWKKPVCIEPEQFGKIYEAEPQERYRLAYLVSLHSGLRRSDVASLSWKQVDVDRGFICLTMKKTRRLVTIPLTPVLKEVFSYLKTKNGGLSSVWGRPIPSDKLGKRFAVASHRAGLDIKFKDLRSSFATHLRRLRVPDQRIATLLGHTSTALVFSTYSYLDAEDLSDDVKFLPVSTGSVAPVGSKETKTTGSLPESR